MKRIRILNVYGVDANSNAADKEPLPYKVETGSDGATYVCFFETGDAPRAIHKITNTGLTVAYGQWSSRESLSYSEPNKNFIIEETI